VSLALNIKTALRKKSRIGGVPLYVLATLFAVLAAFPFVFMVLASLKSQGEFLSNPFFLPSHVTWANFEGLLTPKFGAYFLNSVIVAAVTVTLTVVLGALAAYPLARMNLKINGPILLLFLGGLMVPIHVTLIPIYVMTQQSGLYDSVVALFGPYVAFSLPVTIYILVGFFKQVPESIMQAARVDGAGVWTVFTKILLPLSWPAISTVAIVNFIFVWNEFIFALVLLNSPGHFTLPLGLDDFSSLYRIDVPSVMAALTIASIPTILFFLIAQEKVVSGLAAGALQGE
jgi:raffinose/stachyose/melibiose transport system permease protein